MFDKLFTPITIKDMTLRNRIIMPAVQQESDGEAVFTLTFDNARLWTPETPNLYTCRVSFADDEVTETFGIRKVE